MLGCGVCEFWDLLVAGSLGVFTFVLSGLDSGLVSDFGFVEFELGFGLKGV